MCRELPSPFFPHIQDTSQQLRPLRGSMGVFMVPESMCQFSSVAQLCLTATPWTVACQASLSITNFRECVCVCVCARVCAKLLQSCPTLCKPMDHSPPGSSVQEDSPGKDTGVGCHALLQGIFPTQGSIQRLLCLLHWQAGSLLLSHLGSPSVYGTPN